MSHTDMGNSSKIILGLTTTQNNGQDFDKTLDFLKYFDSIGLTSQTQCMLTKILFS